MARNEVERGDLRVVALGLGLFARVGFLWREVGLGEGD